VTSKTSLLAEGDDWPLTDLNRFQDACFGVVIYDRQWVPSIHFTRDRDRILFLRIAEWLQNHFALQLTEQYGCSTEDGKEYWSFTRESSKWMLVRCYSPLGISLDGYSPTDLTDFESIAMTFQARAVGWRYRIVNFQRKLFPTRFLQRYSRSSDS